MTSRCADDARDLQQVGHGVLEEDEVHAGAANALVVLLQEEEKALLQLLKALNLPARENGREVRAASSLSVTWPLC